MDIVPSCPPTEASLSRYRSILSKIERYRQEALERSQREIQATVRLCKSSEFGSFTLESMLRFGSHDPTYQQHVESPFMNLPVEMRTLIYSYLVPKNMVPSWISKRKLKLPKMDSALPLLRTNRQIYHEMLELWYKSTKYCVSLRENNLPFANKDFGWISNLPPGFRFIKCLSLTIRLEYLSLDHVRKLDRWESRVLQMRLTQVKEIGDFFSTSGPGSLRTLNITVLPVHTFFAELEKAANRREDIRACLDFNLHPLRKVCVSERVSVGRPSRRGLLGCFADHRADVISVMEEYFKWLEREISGSRTQTASAE